ncbi:Oidioi.mRNA.OKI2018_I69.chr1.g1674.t1.cds [Oikopleura dioica]|uniref:Oidioi.mRNA.OKI2018_I69.chr1.g1674.t1.cds n=1 Tax=Oikopleura dioica TaxID=34765 RepID=A0ABN7SNM9_OIKDI|nr:Oidioi.mRNA.OKI2018_I69.chr1.g1674.t1.cds [Oikopleura dioica]
MPSFGKCELPEDLNLDEYSQVNNDERPEEQTAPGTSPSQSPPPYFSVVVNNSPSAPSTSELATEQKSWMEKLKGISIILKIVIALFTIGGIVTPIVVSKTSLRSAPVSIEKIRCVEFRPMTSDFSDSTFPSSKATCNRIGGEVAFFLNQQEFEFFEDRDHPNEEWLGIFRVNGNQWFTPLGEESPVLNWRAGEPSNLEGREDCVQRRSTGKWNDVPCDSWNRSFSCRIERILNAPSKCNENELKSYR